MRQITRRIVSRSSAETGVCFSVCSVILSSQGLIMAIRKRRFVLLCKIRLYNINYQKRCEANCPVIGDAERITKSPVTVD